MRPIIPSLFILLTATASAQERQQPDPKEMLGRCNALVNIVAAQRNSAQNDVAVLTAELEAARSEIARLKDAQIKKGDTAP